MKKFLIFFDFKLIFRIAMGTVFLLTFNYTANATTGGPVVINKIFYNDKNDSVYFLEEDTAKGVFDVSSYNLNTNKIKSEKSAVSNTRFDIFKQRLDKYKLVPRINLSQLNFNFDVQLDTQIRSEYHARWYKTKLRMVRTPLLLTVNRGNKIKKRFNFFGCGRKNVVAIDAFYIDKANHLLIRISNAAICYEHIYIMDRLFGIPNVPIENYKTLPRWRRARRTIGWTWAPDVPPEGTVLKKLKIDTGRMFDNFQHLEDLATAQNNTDLKIEYLFSKWQIAKVLKNSSPTYLMQLIELQTKIGQFGYNWNRKGAKGALGSAYTLFETESSDREHYACELLEKKSLEPLRQHSDFSSLFKFYDLEYLLNNSKK